MSKLFSGPISTQASFLLRPLGQKDYDATWSAMRRFTESRNDQTEDELWLVEHPAVFTLGRAGDPSHVLRTSAIPVIPTDRGGQVTYHGPGQLVIYVLFDLRRANVGVRSFVRRLEQSVIDALEPEQIAAERLPGAPGVYVDGRKLSALGVRVHRGCSYHGLSINVDMDLGPFTWINPCGMPGLEVTQLVDLGLDWDMEQTAVRICHHLTRNLGVETYTSG